MSIKNLEDVLYHGMKDLLSAENQFKSGLKKLADAAQDEELATAYRNHHEETVQQIERLKKGFELLGKKAKSEKCDAAEGLTSEAESAIEETGEFPAKDLMLATAGRKTEHYEIASYDDCAKWAKTLGQTELHDLLKETLAEEKAADKLLAKISTRLAKEASK